MSSYQFKAFVFGWMKTEKVFEFEGTDSEFLDSFLKIDHKINQQVAEQFGVVITHVKAFPTDNSGWIIIDKHTKRLLHKGLKNQNEVNELCQRMNYIKMVL